MPHESFRYFRNFPQTRTFPCLEPLQVYLGVDSLRLEMLAPVKTAVQDIKRLREITTVLTRHGFQAAVMGLGMGRFLPEEEQVTQFEGDSTSLIGEVERRALKVPRTPCIEIVQIVFDGLELRGRRKDTQDLGHRLGRQYL